MKRKTPILTTIAGILGLAMVPSVRAADIAVGANITTNTTWTANNAY